MTFHFHPDPGVLDGLLVLVTLYLLAVGPGRSLLAPPGTAFPRRQAAWFMAGVTVLFLAVATPLDEISEQYLFSAHMFQHVLLIYPVAIFWLLGLPDWTLRPLVSMDWSRPLARLLTRPLVTFLVFNGLFYIWHLPPLYEWALRDSKIHFLEHAGFIGAALLVWWPILSPLKEFPRLPWGSQLLYLLAGSIVQIPLFGILTFSPDVLYPTYRDAPRLLALTALEDQQLGAVLMKLSAMLFMFGTLAIVFFRWYAEDRARGSRSAPPRQSRPSHNAGAGLLPPEPLPPEPTGAAPEPAGP